MTDAFPVLITGGAGYIGSHAVLAFREAGAPVVVLDDLSTGRRERVPEDVIFVEGGAGDGALVRDIIQSHDVAAVVHFAGSIVVPESVTDPLMYYRNNTCVSRALIEACIEGGVGRFVFSSTAAVYGMPDTVPIPENAPTLPINPYGTSKLMTEWVLRDTAAARELAGKDFRYVALRCRPGRAQRTGLACRHARDRGCESRRARTARRFRNLRGRLRHAGRHLHPRLHPRLRFGRSARARPAPPRGRRVFDGA